MTSTTTETRTAGRALDGLVRPFGTTAATLLAGVAGLQTSLALGAPWGDHVWGGSLTGRLPLEMRFVSGAAAVALLGMATVVLARADVVRRLSTWRP